MCEKESCYLWIESENTEKQNKFIYYLAHDIHGKLHPGVQRKEKP